MKYAFIRAHQTEFHVRAMCRVLRVHFSGFYAWQGTVKPGRCAADRPDPAGLVRQWRVYGYQLTDDLRDQGEQVSENRVARLADGYCGSIAIRRLDDMAESLR